MLSGKTGPSSSVIDDISGYQREIQRNTLQFTIEAGLGSWLKEDAHHFNWLNDTLKYTPYESSPAFSSLSDDVKRLLTNPKEVFPLMAQEITEEMMKKTILSAINNALTKHTYPPDRPVVRKKPRLSVPATTTGLVTASLKEQAEEKKAADAKNEHKTEKSEERVIDDISTATHFASGDVQKYYGEEANSLTIYKPKKSLPTVEDSKPAAVVLTPPA